MAGPITNDYISTTRKSFVSNDNDGKMIEKNFIEIEGTFLVKIHDNALNGKDRENVFEHINSFLEVVEPLKDDLVEKFVQKFYNLFDHNEEDEAEDDKFNYLLKIDPDLFTYDVQKIKTYDEYEQELNNDITKGPEEPWSENGVPYRLCDHICEPYRFKDGKTKWPTCSSHINGFCNGGELPGMVRVGSITYFQDHRWYDELTDGKLKDETLALKAKIEGSWGDAIPEVNAHEIALFTRMEIFGWGPYSNMKTEWTSNPYLDVNRIFGRNYEASNVSDTQENQGHEEHKGNPNPKPSNCKIKDMKNVINDDEEYITIKESEYLNHSKDIVDAYRELLRLIDEGWVVTIPDE
ncbi:hypothetical protein Tco_0810205 [Tanacetum coccineum]